MQVNIKIIQINVLDQVSNIYNVSTITKEQNFNGRSLEKLDLLKGLRVKNRKPEKSNYETPYRVKCKEITPFWFGFALYVCCYNPWL